MGELRNASELWAWMVLPTATHPGGVLSMALEPGPVSPMMSTDQEQMSALREHVVRAAEQTGHTLVLQRFVLAEVADVVTPALLDVP